MLYLIQAPLFNWNGSTLNSRASIFSVSVEGKDRQEAQCFGNFIKQDGGCTWSEMKCLSDIQRCLCISVFIILYGVFLCVWRPMVFGWGQQLYFSVNSALNFQYNYSAKIWILGLHKLIRTAKSRLIVKERLLHNWSYFTYLQFFFFFEISISWLNFDSVRQTAWDELKW